MQPTKTRTGPRSGGLHQPILPHEQSPQDRADEASQQNPLHALSRAFDEHAPSVPAPSDATAG